ncbi:MAG: protein translocase subunit SecF [Polyangiaceae bacterium]|nr:protein translocase subunit SecF [Polyangiaceae bacterium]
MEVFKPGSYYNFMGQKNIWLIVSAVVCLVSLAGFWLVGLNFGTDFRGGTEIEVAFKVPVSGSDINEKARVRGFSEPNIIHVADSEKPHRFMIRVQEVTAIDEPLLVKIQDALCFVSATEGDLPEGRCPKDKQPTELKVSPGGDKITLRFDHAPDLEHIFLALVPPEGSSEKAIEGVELRDGRNSVQVVSVRDQKVEIQLKSKGDQLIDGLKELDPGVEPLRVEWIGPKAGKLLRDSAFMSIGISLVLIMAYVAIRFDLRFAPGSVVSLAHNAIVVLGIYVLFQIEFTLIGVASLLTLIGYSLNDTVVVYDRIRENLGKHRGQTLSDLVNLSVSETLSRTILTMFSTGLVLVPFLIWSTGDIRRFALSFIIGIAVAPYSTIFVAAPVTMFFDSRVFGASKSSGQKQPVRKRETAVV